MRTSAFLREHVENGQVGFGINHAMSDFKLDRRKNLDLVLCSPARGEIPRAGKSFSDLVDQYEIELDSRELAALRKLPPLFETPAGSVRAALEAKACMTAHVKAKPRLYDELNSSHLTIHGASQMAIAAGFLMVNVAPDFISPGRTGFCPDCGHEVMPVNKHKQPRDAEQVVAKVRQLPRRASVQEDGFDAFAIVAVECHNDGSRVELRTDPPAPPPGDIFHYDQMIDRFVHLYETRFPRVRG